MDASTSPLNVGPGEDKVPTWDDLLRAGRTDAAVHLACRMAEMGVISREEALIRLALHQARIVQESREEIVKCRALHARLPDSLDWAYPPGW